MPRYSAFVVRVNNIEGNLRNMQNPCFSYPHTVKHKVAVPARLPEPSA